MLDLNLMTSARLMHLVAPTSIHLGTTTQLPSKPCETGKMYILLFWGTIYLLCVLTVRVITYKWWQFDTLKTDFQPKHG